MPYRTLKFIGKISFIGWLCATVAMPGFAAPPGQTAPASQDKVENAGKGSFGDYLAGRFAESQGDTGHGIEYLKDSIKRDPNNKDLLKNLFRMQVLSGNIEEAVSIARQLEEKGAGDTNGEFSTEMLLAIGEAAKGHFDLADKHLASVSSVGFNSLLVPQMRAWINLGKGDVKAPVDVKSMESEGHVVLPQIYLNAAFINDLAGFDAQAKEQYTASVKDARIEPFRAVEALVNFYTRKGMDKERKQLVSDYLSAHGSSYLTDELLVQPEPASIKPLVTNAREGIAEVFYTVANIFHGVRTPADEIATLHLALYLRPDFPAAQFLLAGAYELAQDYKMAAATYKTIDSKSPYFMRGRIRAAYDEVSLNHKDVALAELDKIAQQNPSEIDALLAKGDILRIEKQYKEAVLAYDAAAARVKTPEKRHWIIYFSRGTCYQAENQWEKAEADMKHALALSPEEPEVLNYLGYSWLTMRHNITEARKMVEEAYNARPEDAQIIDSMGYALYVTADFSHAAEYFEQALERIPNDATINDHLGDTYWQLGRKTEAKYQWERALGDNPDEDTAKGLHAKLKDGLAMIHAQPPTEDEKAVKPPTEDTSSQDE